jgi:hypothetical protein
MIDAFEVLNMGFTPQCLPIYGAFPINKSHVELRVNLEGGNVKHVIANSVLHYVKHDDLLEDFFTSIIGILNLGSAAFIGDIPSSELKLAQSEVEGRTFVDSANNFSYLELADVARKAAKLGASIYLIPQPREFPMSPHRLDLLLFKNEKSRLWN